MQSLTQWGSGPCQEPSEGSTRQELTRILKQASRKDKKDPPSTALITGAARRSGGGEAQMLNFPAVNNSKFYFWESIKAYWRVVTLISKIYFIITDRSVVNNNVVLEDGFGVFFVLLAMPKQI